MNKTRKVDNNCIFLEYWKKAARILHAIFTCPSKCYRCVIGMIVIDLFQNRVSCYLNDAHCSLIIEIFSLIIFTFFFQMIVHLIIPTV